VAHPEQGGGLRISGGRLAAITGSCAKGQRITLSSRIFRGGGLAPPRRRIMQRRAALGRGWFAFETAATTGSRPWTGVSLLVALRESKRVWRNIAGATGQRAKAVPRTVWCVTSKTAPKSSRGRMCDEQQSKEILIARAQPWCSAEKARGTPRPNFLVSQGADSAAWKTVGIVPRGRRGSPLVGGVPPHCDPCFSPPGSRALEFRVQRPRWRAQRLGDCSSVGARRNCQLGRPSLGDSTAPFTELQGAFDAVGEFPRALRARDLTWPGRAGAER